MLRERPSQRRIDVLDERTSVSWIVVVSSRASERSRAGVGAINQAIEDLLRKTLREVEQQREIAIKGTRKSDDRFRGWDGTVILDAREVRPGEVGADGHIVERPSLGSTQSPDVLAEGDLTDHSSSIDRYCGRLQALRPDART